MNESAQNNLTTVNVEENHICKKKLLEHQVTNI